MNSSLVAAEAGSQGNTTPEPGGTTYPTGLRPWITAAVAGAVLLATAVSMFLPVPRELIGLNVLVMMVVLIFLGMPVGMAMIVPSLLGMYALRGMRLVESTLADLPYQQVASWTLSVIPMFVLMGLLLWRAGLTESLYTAGRQWLGWLPGGLAVGTNLAGTGLAAVSGSTVGTTYALARIGIPEMLKAGYDRRLAIGAIIVAGLPGQLIPPSILLVIYAGIVEVPIGPQLLAGVGPGLLVSLMFTIMIIIFAWKWAPSARGHAALPSVSWEERLRSLARVWPVPLLIAIIIVGMFSGLFTATEAGAVAALFAVLITFIWKRGGGAWQTIASAASGAGSTVGAIFFMLIGVAALSRVLTMTGISDGFAGLVESMSLSQVQFLLLMTVVYVLLGMFMEPLPMMVLTIPILMPTIASLDISLLWYGVFAVFMGELAVLTPPVGILTFIIHSITRDPEVNQGQNITINDVYRAVWCFFPMAMVVVLILIFWPQIATFLPEMMAQGAT